MAQKKRADWRHQSERVAKVASMRYLLEDHPPVPPGADVPSLEDFALDPELGNFPEASPAQRLTLRLLDGLPPADAQQREIAKMILGRPWGSDLEGQRRVVALIMGADSGKSVMAAELLVHRALYGSLAGLRPGQVPVALLVAPDVRLASIPLDYARGIVQTSAQLRAELDGEPGPGQPIRFRRGSRIEVLPATAGGSAVRGRRYLAAVLEEVAFFRDASYRVNDQAIVRAILPRLLSGGQLLAISTPWRKQGWLWDLFRREHGKCLRSIVAQAPTAVMRPNRSLAKLEEDLADDPEAIATELEAQFLDNVTDLFSEWSIEAVTVAGREGLAPQPGLHYIAFADPSGGSSDSFGLAVAHLKDTRSVVDVTRAWEPPFRPTEVVREIADVLRSYRIAKVTGDRYAGEWPREAFAKEGIHYDVAERTKSELYLEMLPAVNSGRVELLDLEEVKGQLRRLERRRGPSGKDRVDHPPRGHDDLANAVAGVVVELLGKARVPGILEWARQQKARREEEERREKGAVA